MTNVKINVQLLITVLLKYWQRIKDSAKGPPFQLVHFYRNLQNRPRLKGPPFDFFRHCATFFENFLMSQRVPPLRFLLFCNRMHIYKSKKSPFYIFRHCATFSERGKSSKISSFLSKKNVLRFLSLRYSADFRRSHLVDNFRLIFFKPRSPPHNTLRQCEIFRIFLGNNILTFAYLTLSEAPTLNLLVLFTVTWAE